MSNTNSFDKKYYSDLFLEHSFKDLIMLSVVANNGAHGTPMVDYNAFFCSQSIEKLIKSILIQKNIICSFKDIKDYSHNLVKLYEKLCSNEENLKHEIESIGVKTYKHEKVSKFYNCLNQSNSAEKFPIFLKIIESGYMDARYPPKPNEDEDFYWLKKDKYWNYGIVTTTIETYKVLLKYIQDEKKESLWLFSWAKQQDAYDEPTSEIVAYYKESELLLRYVTGLNPQYILTEWITLPEQS